MRAYCAFFKKEWLEYLRTYKLIILGAVFLLLGIMNPLSAKFLPELLNTMIPEGMSVTLAPPAAIDSYLQFFKNVSQIGLIVLVIVFSGMLSGEMQKGTLVQLLTKGLSRSTVLLAKFTCSALLWSVSYVLCFGVTYGYTVYLFPGDSVQNLPLAAFCLWLFGILLLGANLFGGVLFKSNYGCLLFTAGFAGTLFLFNIFPDVQEYSPAALTANNTLLLTGAASASDFTVPVLIGAGITLLFIAAAVFLFRKKQVS